MKNLKNLDELESIINRCYSGELEHNQEEYFCGTACCLAGWSYALAHKLDNTMRIDMDLDSQLIADFVKARYGLSNFEAELFFMPYATKALHYAALNWLKAGCRLWPIDDAWYVTHNSLKLEFSFESDLYAEAISNLEHYLTIHNVPYMIT